MSATTDQLDWDTLKGAFNMSHVNWYAHERVLLRHTTGVYARLSPSALEYLRVVRDLGGNRPS